MSKPDMTEYERGTIIFFVDNDDESKVIGVGIELGKTAVRVNEDGTLHPAGKMAPAKLVRWPASDSAGILRAFFGVAATFCRASRDGAVAVGVATEIIMDDNKVKL